MLDKYDLPGGKTVETDALLRVVDLGREVLARSGLLEVSGPQGTGKSYACRALGRVLAAEGCRIVRLELASRSSGWHVLRDLVAALGGDWRGLDGPGLTREALALLSGCETLVLIDEAYLMGRRELQVLRYLHDHDDARFALVIVGPSFRHTYRLVPEIESRVTRRARFAKLAGDELVENLRGFHPLYADADKRLLLAIDAEYCRGLWRNWRVATRAFVDYGDRLGRQSLDETIIGAALSSITGLE